MSSTIIPRDQAAQGLHLTPEVLVRYEERGLIRASREGDLVGYTPREVRRLWTVVTCHRDLGVNLAGIEVVLRLREQIDEIHRRLDTLARRMDDALGPPDPPPADHDG